MKKLVYLFLGLITSINIYSQDSIVNYLDQNFKITEVKNDTHYLKITVKRDSVWENRIYHRDGKILFKNYSYKPYKNSYVGKFLRFHRNKNISKRVFFNKKSNEEGKIITWFDNRKRNYTGSYKDGIPKGIWKYYHYNGKLASKFYYNTNGDIDKYILYDTNGLETNEKDYIKFLKPKFKGGIDKFNSKLNYLIDNLSYGINTKLYINFTIDVDGNIKDVIVVNNIPKKLKKEISDFFESIKGWESAIEMNRKIPYKYRFSISFKTRIIDTD
ncbi:MAG: hypothetical protein ACPGUU_03450 [Flavobacteriaceae bacterium]